MTANAATITLYYDTDTTAGGEVQIVYGLSENADGTAGSYTWDTSSPTSIISVVNGNYYILARIDDGYNSPVYDYSDGTLTINHVVNQPPSIPNLAASGSTGDVAITYDLLEATAEQIESTILAAGAQLGGGWTERLRRALVHYTEDCEAANMEVSDRGLHHHHH